MSVFTIFVFLTLLTVCFSTKQARIVKLSKVIPGTSIEYSKNTLCDTSNSNPSYSGYVHLTSPSIPDLQGAQRFNISTYFWYFPARKDHVTAPLALYLAGGPGQSSTYAALSGTGPCYALPNGNSTAPNPFSLNDRVNVLYVDQPNQVGFSYDMVVDGALDVLSGDIYPGMRKGNTTMIPGQFASQIPQTTANTTALAARGMWHFLQVWFAEFAEYKGPNDTISIWGHSYGAMYTTSLSNYILNQNVKLQNNIPACPGTKAVYRRITVPTIGIMNGCLDLDAQATSFATYPNNNTYYTGSNGITSPVRLYDDATYQYALSQVPGCLNAVQRCRIYKAKVDPSDTGANSAANSICAQATLYCLYNVQGPFYTTGASDFDIASPAANPHPPTYAATFLNQPWVRAALGVPKGLNYTLQANTVLANFLATGDPMRAGMAEVTNLLRQGVQVSMIYGDRDWKCNWIGGEKLSLNLPWPLSSAGYTPLILPHPAAQSNAPAHVRQHTLLSFTRVMQSGHYPTWDSPITTQTIFNRAMLHLDIPSGQRPGKTYVSTGDKTSRQRDKLPVVGVLPECSLWNVGMSCTENQIKALTEGTAKVDGWKVVEPKE